MLEREIAELTDRVNAMRVANDKAKKEAKEQAIRSDKQAELETKGAIKDDDNTNIVATNRSSSSNTGSQSIGIYEATYYTAYCVGCSGVTYTGHDARASIYTPEGYRIIAVDPTHIPLGSLVNVTHSDGTSYEAVASDIGGDIKGARIDVLVGDKAEALTNGRHDVSIEILRKGSD